MADFAKAPPSSILPGCNVLNTRAGLTHYVKHIQRSSQSPLDLDILASAWGVLVDKNEVWSGRADASGYAVRAGVDERVSSHDRCGLKSFYCNEDAVSDVPGYVKKILSETGISEACLILAAIYTDRIQLHVSMCFEETFLVQRPTVRRLLLVASMIASKIYDVDAPDDTWRISKWAAVGEIPPDHLRQLEQRFLAHSLQFSLYVHWQEFEFKRSIMEELCKTARPLMPSAAPSDSSVAEASIVLGEGPLGLDMPAPAPSGTVRAGAGAALCCGAG